MLHLQNIIADWENTGLFRICFIGVQISILGSDVYIYILICTNNKVNAVYT